MHHTIRRAIRRRPQMIVGIHSGGGEMCLLRCDTIRTVPRLGRALGDRRVLPVDWLISRVVVGGLRWLALSVTLPLLFLPASVVVFLMPPTLFLLLSGTLLLLPSTLLFLPLIGKGTSEWIQRINGRGCHRHGMSIDGLRSHRARGGCSCCLFIALAAARTCSPLWRRCSSLRLDRRLRNGLLVHLRRRCPRRRRVGVVSCRGR